MKNNNPLLPELRFPEFKNDGEWEEKKILDIGDFINGLNSKTAEDFGNGSPYITYKQVFDSSVVNLKNCSKVQVYENENQNTIKKGDILFTTSSETQNEVGFASVVLEEPEEKTYLNSFCFALRPFDLEKTNSSFSRYLFHSSLYRDSVGKLAQGSTRFNLSKSSFGYLLVFFPNPLEQQKIADCLSSLDALLEAHQEKLSALQKHKKGLLQHLFPQENQKVPNFRFKEFENEGEWEEKPLDKIAKRIIKKNKEGKINTVFTNSASDGIVNQRDYFDRDIANKSNLEGYYIVKPGDYVYNPRISNLAPVGPIARNNTNEIGAMSPLYTVFRFNIKENDFFEYYFTTKHWYNSVKKIANSGARFDRINLSANEFMNIPVLYPEPKEQQKIADTLSSLDSLIQAQTQKIEQLQNHKKGLLQGLFPKIKE